MTVPHRSTLAALDPLGLVAMPPLRVSVNNGFDKGGNHAPTTLIAFILPPTHVTLPTDARDVCLIECVKSVILFFQYTIIIMNKR